MTKPFENIASERIEHVAETGSTSADLFSRAIDGETGTLWRVSDLQTSGRGRNTRNWVSPAGNLYASLLLTNPAPPEHVAELSFVLSLALRDAVLAAARLSEDGAVRIKWPNDLMVSGRKSAGLLLEGGRAHGAGFVVAGFGVNIVSHPDNTTHPATHLQADGYHLDRDGLFSALREAVRARLLEWNRGAGFAAIRAAWLAVAHGRGENLRVNLLGESFTGSFSGIDAMGRLLVATETGERTVSAGDVFALGDAAAGQLS